MSNGTIPQPRESWKITNITSGNLYITDVPSLPVLEPNVEVEAMDYTTAGILGASDVFRNFLTSIPPKISSPGYLHTHDDRAWADHTHVGLDILTGGSASNADSLHTHFISTTIPEEYVVEDDLIAYVRKDGSITQLSDIASTGEQIEAAIAKAHEEEHTLLQHVDDEDPFTIANFRKLLDGSNADCCHTHALDIIGEHNDLDGLDGGTTDEYYHFNLSQYTEIVAFFAATDITGAQAENLTDGSNADSLHIHTGLGGLHNTLGGIQGGEEDSYYHLTDDQYYGLIGGPSVIADEYHTHSNISTEAIITEHNNLEGLQGGEPDRYYHLTDDQYYGLIGGPSVIADEYHSHSTILDHDALINTHNLTTDIDHDTITNTHNLTEDVDHNLISNLQGGEEDKYYHLSDDQYYGLIGGPSVNADEYHTHSSMDDHNLLVDLQGGTTDQYYHFTFAQWLETNVFFANTDITGAEAETLTDGSNADALHFHADPEKEHNSLNGLQGGTLDDPSLPPEYYHLDSDQYDALLFLIGGPSVDADDYHTHSFDGLEIDTTTDMAVVVTSHPNGIKQGSEYVKVSEQSGEGYLHTHHYQMYDSSQNNKAEMAYNENTETIDFNFL